MSSNQRAMARRRARETSSEKRRRLRPIREGAVCRSGLSSLRSRMIARSTAGTTKYSLVVRASSTLQFLFCQVHPLGYSVNPIGITIDKWQNRIVLLNNCPNGFIQSPILANPRVPQSYVHVFSFFGYARNSVTKHPRQNHYCGRQPNQPPLEQFYRVSKLLNLLRQVFR